MDELFILYYGEPSPFLAELSQNLAARETARKQKPVFEQIGLF